MKKLILIALLSMAFITPTVAQDTVRYGDSCYLFKEVSSDFYARRHETTGEYEPYGRTFFNGPSLKGCIPDTEINVYGVAATMLLHPVDDTITSWYTAYLYRDNDTYFELVDSSTAYSCKNMFLYSATIHGQTPQNGQHIEEYVPCLEFYFSKPHVMNGSFAVGLKRKIHYNSPIEDSNGIYEYVHAITSRDDSEPLFSPDHSIQLAYGWWGGLFPIIQPERIGCKAVAEVSEKGDDFAVLAWDMDGDSCQLSITPYDMPFDPGTVIDLHNNTYMATGLDSGVYYAARLRTQCHHHCHIHADTVVWGNWGEPTLFYLGSQEPDTTGSLGIHQMSAEPSCSITPNPAHAIATVQCSAGIMGVEVLSVKGETLMHKDVAGEQACTLDLTGLSKGIYIVQITTPQGTAARKLAVE